MELAKYKCEVCPYKRQWIPCSDMLPEVHDSYLVWWTDDRKKYFYEISEFIPEEGWVGSIPQASHGKYTVIAWMPLPEPYKEGEEDG